MSPITPSAKTGLPTVGTLGSVKTTAWAVKPSQSGETLLWKIGENDGPG